ncbi:YciI family protein [Actinocorallia lasiicapitis]
MPRYLMILTADENAPVGAPPAALFEAIGQTAAAWQAQGVLLDTGGLTPTAAGTRLSLQDGEIVAQSGPFTAETATAYAIIRTPDKKDAVARATEFLDLHKQHWPAWNGGSEIREIFGTDD